LFFLLLERLALDAEGSYGAGFEPLVRNVSTTPFAYSVCGRIHPLKRFVNLLEQLPFAVANAHRKVLIDFDGRLVADVGKCLNVTAMCQDFPCLIENCFPLAFKITANIRILSILKISPSRSR